MFPIDSLHSLRSSNPPHNSDYPAKDHFTYLKPKDSIYYPLNQSISKDNIYTKENIYAKEPKESLYTNKEPSMYMPKDISHYSKDSSFYSKDSTFCSKESYNSRESSFHSRKNPYFIVTKDEDIWEPDVHKKVCLDDNYDGYHAKTTSFVDKKPQLEREIMNNTINFTNVNSLTHFQRKNVNPLNFKISLFDQVKTEEKTQNLSFSGKNTRGLKNLSIKVREFVIKHKETTYKEIADQLLKEMKRTKHSIENTKEEQNIKRRIYDALNVLVATEIFKKKGKTVYYDGKSTVMGHDLMNKRVLVNKEELLAKIQEKKECIAVKQKALQSTLIKNLAIKNLLHRNFMNSNKIQESHERFEFPFLLLSMNSNSLTLKMNKNKNKLGIFSKSPLNILGDMDVLIKLNLHKVEKSMIEKWFPRDVIHYLPEDINEEDE